MNIEEKELNIALDSEEGGVVISEEVISVIASVAAKGVKGVFGMSTTISGGFAEFLGKKNSSKGVKVAINGGFCTIDVYITVEYGAVIPDIAWEIQERVKSDVEAMTGLEVENVNVNIENVNVKEKASEKENAEECPKDSKESESANEL